MAYVLLVILQVLDVHSTNKVLAQGGVELNPVMRFLMKVLGEAWWAGKVVMVAIGAGLAFTHDLHLLIWVLDAVYIVVVANNYRHTL